MKRIHLGWFFVWLGFGLVIWLVWVSVFEERTLPPELPPVEDVADRDAQYRRAFAEGNTVVRHRELEVFFRNFLLDLTIQDTEKTMGHFDVDRLRVYAEESLAFPEGREHPVQVNTRLSTAVFQACREGRFLEVPDRIDLALVDERQGDRRIIVYALHRLPNGDCLPMRWWLEKPKNDYQIADIEDPRQGMRLSELVATQALVAMSAKDRNAREQGWQDFRDALEARQLKDFKLAQRKFDASAMAPWSGSERVTWHCQRMALAWDQKDDAKLDAELSALEKHRPGLPVIRIWKATRAYQAKDWAKVREQAEAYIALFGHERVLSVYLAQALIETQQRDAAKQVLRQALLRFPNDSRMKELLAKITP
ncbi:MAG: tetratricopeptide repeat protein [Fimbriiglobus sp.]